uniref:Putative DNA polymerase n=1 Tax=viral metagenome TaxID=1070528 RepID=A0A6M3KXV3_9ZZZZ
MKVNKQTFKQVLGKLKPALSKNHVIKESGQIIFEGGYLIAFDGETAIHLPFKSDFKGVGVSADKLLPLVDKSAGSEITLEAEGGVVKFKCGRVKAELSTVSIAPLDVTGGLHEIEWVGLPEGFLKAIKFCSLSASKDISKGMLCSVRVESDRLVATDAYRLTVQKLKQAIDIERVVYIPSFKIADVITFAPTKFDIGKASMHFSTGAGEVITISAIEPQGVYPDFEAILKDCKGDSITLPKDALIRTIERAEIFAEEIPGNSKWHTLNIEIGGGKLICRGEGGEGKIEEGIRVEDKAFETSFKINSAFFKEALSMCNTMVDSENKVLFKGVGLSHIICKVV